MKVLAVTILILIVGCATAPSRPNEAALMDAVMNYGMKADQVNQIYADYDKARAEYEQTASYKAIPYLVAPLLILGGAAGNMPYCGYRGSGYGCLPGKAVINTIPTGGGGSTSTIKWYR